MIVESGFRPAWWLRGAHAQTMWQTLFRWRPRLRLRRERLELPDGDFLDLDWSLRTEGPIVLVLHGLAGCSRAPYIQGLLAALDRAGMRGVVMHFRGCSGQPNRLPRSYHAGEAEDLQFTMRHLVRTHPHTPLAAVGFSIGGSALVHWLAREGAAAPVQAAVGVSVPFVLDHAAQRLESGLSRVYQWRLLRQLKRTTRHKFRTMACPVSLEGLEAMKTFREFDHRVTAPLHGFDGVDDYYRRCSSRPLLRKIQRPTLLLHALDDPFMHGTSVPSNSDIGEAVSLEVSAHGGHVGFIGGPWPWRPRYWIEERIPRYLAGQWAVQREPTQQPRCA